MSLAFKRAVVACEESSYYKADMIDFFADLKLSKPYKITIDWELVKAQQGAAKLTGNSDAKEEPAPIVIAHLIGNNRLTFLFKDSLSRLLRDDLGKEAFQEAFDTIVVRAKVAGSSCCKVVKEGKTLVFNVDVQLDNWMNVDRACDAAQLAKDIEAML